jgi:hypothetical protein
MSASDSARQRYIRGQITFREYYGLLVECLGEDTLRCCLPIRRTPEQWRDLVAADEHLNNVPLHRWDTCHSYVRQLAGRAAGREAITGSGGWSLSDSVCVLKETARRYAESTR